MKRRDFLKNIPLATLPLMSNQLFANALHFSTMGQTAALSPTVTNNVLVIIQLEGGNDSLNTVLPLDQYTNLATARGNVLIPSNKALQLGSFQTGLHPSLTGLKSLYDAKRLCVVQGVGYANPNRSHFRSTDILLSGSDSNQLIDTGWAGRYLDYEFPGFPTGYPSAAMPDPPAIQIGGTISRGLFGANISIGETIPWWFNGNITQLSNFINTTMPTTYSGSEISFLRTQQLNANKYANSIINAWNAGGVETVAYAVNTQNNIADQLKLVARLIKGGLKTKIYWVKMNGFDTHGNQVESGNTHKGVHAALLKDLSDSILTFMTDCNNRSIDDRVMGMTFSEFGRQIISNSSLGTDHGTVGSMFVFGKSVNPTVVGANPQIPANAQWNTSLTEQYDYRQVYASLLQGWFCVPANNIPTIISHSTPISTTNSTCSAVLPIEITHFDAERANKNDVHVEWFTASETNSLQFELQRSTNVRLFSTIATLKAKGNSQIPTQYDWLDKNLPSNLHSVFYYRLKTTEQDGSVSYSVIRSVEFDHKNDAFQADVFPNPSQNGVFYAKLSGNLPSESPIEITIHDYFGRRVFHSIKTIMALDAPVTINLGNQLGEGVYILDIKNEQQVFVKKIVISK